MSSGSRADERVLNRRIMENNIERDPIGRQLTPEARQSAIEFAVDVWQGDMGSGKAARLGIQHVTSEILKPK